MPTAIFSDLVTCADYTTLGFSVFSVGLIGQSLIARLRNEFVANHKPSKASQQPLSEQVEYGWFRKVSVPESSSVNQDSVPTTSEVSAHEQASVNQEPVEDPWHSPNVSACVLPAVRCETVRHYEPPKLLQPAAVGEVEPSAQKEGAHSPGENGKTPTTKGNERGAPPTEEFTMQQSIKTLQKHARERKIPYYKRYSKRELLDTLNGKAVNYK